MSRTVRVATAQMQAFPLDQAEHSLQAVERLLRSAAEQGVELLVLPECAYPAYLIGSEAGYRSAEVLSQEDYFVFLGRWARKKRMHIVSGFIEDTHTCLHNSAVLIDAEGQVRGTYRKSFLWGADNQYFTPGDRGGVFETELGAIGMVICADTRAPEILAHHALAQAEVIAMPTCWVNVAKAPDRYENPQPEFLIPARSREFHLPFACANKFGMETPKIGYCGRSMITASDGAVLYEAPGTGEALGVVDVVLRDAGTQQYRSPHWHRVLEMNAAQRTQPVRNAPFEIALCPTARCSAEEQAALAADGVAALVALDAESPPPSTLAVWTPQPVMEPATTPLGSVGYLDADALSCFDSARILSLQGIEMLCVFDSSPDAAGIADVQMLRTRAVENRIFLLAVGRRSATVVGPDGGVRGQVQGSDSPLRVSINPADAAVKTVAPGTDIWEQRRVQAYA